MPHTCGFSGSQTPSSFQPHSDIQSLMMKNEPISGAAASLHPTAWQQLIATDTASQQPVSSHLASQQLVTSPEPARQRSICQSGSQEGASHNHRRSARTRQRLPQSGAPSHGMFVQTEGVENQKISIWIFLWIHAWLLRYVEGAGQQAKECDCLNTDVKFHVLLLMFQRCQKYDFVWQIQPSVRKNKTEIKSLSTKACCWASEWGSASAKGLDSNFRFCSFTM